MYQNYTIGQTEFVLNYNYDLPQNHVARLISDFVDSIPQDVLLEDSDYQIYKLLMSSNYKTAQRKTGLSRSTLYRLKKRIQKRK